MFSREALREKARLALQVTLLWALDLFVEINHWLGLVVDVLSFGWFEKVYYGYPNERAANKLVVPMMFKVNAWLSRG